MTAQGGSLTFSHSAAGVDGVISSRTSSGSNSGGGSSYDCTTFDFPVLLNGDSMHGNITARLLLPKVGLSLQLPDPIMVSEPLLLSVTTTLVNITADQAPFAVGVRLSRPAPAGGVTVQLQLGDAGAAKVMQQDLSPLPQGSIPWSHCMPASGLMNAKCLRPTRHGGCERPQFGNFGA